MRKIGEGNDNPFQYSCLETPMDRGAWWVTVHGVARVRHDLATKLPPHQWEMQLWHHDFQCSLIASIAAAAAAKSLQSRPTLCDPINGSPPGSSVPGILQTRIGVGCHFLLPCIKVKNESEVTQSCPTLSDPVDWSLPGSSVHGIFQARVLEWGAIAFSEVFLRKLNISLWET